VVQCGSTEKASRGMRAAPLAVAAAGLVALAAPRPGHAQIAPSGVSGYDAQLGVTVLSRLHPLYEPPGVRLGSFVINPGLDQSIVYNSNVNGTPHSESWASQTSGSVSAHSDWTRNSLGASIDFTNYAYFRLPQQDYTDWTASLSGGYTIGDSQLTAAYVHQSFEENGTTIGAIRTETPFTNTADAVRLGYTFNFNRFSLTPDLNFTAERFGTATVLGVPLNQQFLDRNIVAGGVTGRYSMSDVGNLVVSLRGVSSNYLRTEPGLPSNNSLSGVLLGGIEYQPNGPFRYVFMLGVEVRSFQASQYATRTEPVASASVIWSPTGLTTLTGTLSREIEDPESGGTNGFALTSARLVADHELRRNVFLQARGSINYAEFLQSGGGTETNYTLGAGATWLLNRNMRLSLNYDYTQQIGTSGTNFVTTPNGFDELTTLTTAPYTQHLVALTLHVGL
jgi:hypothetical protein